jgi:hypothetical protein
LTAGLELDDAPDDDGDEEPQPAAASAAQMVTSSVTVRVCAMTVKLATVACAAQEDLTSRSCNICAGGSAQWDSGGA